MRLIFAIAAILAAGPALAQEIPEGQSCGGLFCDLGIVGHKTAPAKAAPVPPPAKAALAPATSETTIVAEPKKRIVHRKRVAPVAVAAKPTVAEPAIETPPTSVAAVPVATVPVAAAPAKRPPPAPPAAAPPGDEPVIFLSPASQAPVAKDMFQPIYR